MNTATQPAINQDDREELISYIWDGFKSLHGVRPRFYDFESMTTDDLEQIANAISNEIELEIEAEAAAKAKHLALLNEAKSSDRGITWTNEDWQEGSQEDPINNQFHEYAYINPEPVKNTSLADALQAAIKAA